MIVPVPKHATHWQIPTNCYTDSNKVIQEIINDKWNSNPLGDSIHGKKKQEHLVPALQSHHWDWVRNLSRWTELYVLNSQNICVSLAALIKGTDREWIRLLGLSGLREEGLKNHEINNWQTQTCRPHRSGHARPASAAERQYKNTLFASTQIVLVSIFISILVFKTVKSVYNTLIFSN